MAGKKKVENRSAIISALGVVVAAIIAGLFALFGGSHPGDSIRQKSTSGTNIACQDSSCVGK